MLNRQVPGLLLLMLLSACEREPNPFAEPAASSALQTAPPASLPPQQAHQAPSASAQAAWDLGLTLLSAAYSEAEQLQVKVEALLQAPSDQALDHVKQQWLGTAQAYEGFYIYTRLGLVEPKTYLPLLDQHNNVAPWPVQPGFLDGFGDYPMSGIVFDVDLPITEIQLRTQHGMTDAADVALGLYALQFVLFGEFDGRAPEALTAKTALTEAQRSDGYIHIKELPTNRRRELAKLLAELVKADLAQLGRAWQAIQPHFSALPQTQWLPLLLRAGLAMVTEQLLVLADYSQNQEGLTAEERAWQQAQLAQRLVAQLGGWQRVLELVPASAAAPYADPTAQALSLLRQWSTTEAPIAETHRALRSLAAALQAQVESF